jgi:hypothetical protein
VPPRIEASDAPRREGHGVLDRLIRSPDALLSELDGAGGPRLLGTLAAIAFGGHAAYGLVVGSFSGGEQWWAAPAKIVCGAALCGAICFPSLYIFASFSGADIGPRRAIGLVLGLLAMTGVLLAGFAPVSWVFSQSSTYTSFIGAVHLAVWTLSLLVGGRVLSSTLRHWKAKGAGLSSLWLLIFLVTCCQMMTTLRPIVGRSPKLLDPERRFFLQHWVETMGDEANRSDRAPPR